MLSMRCELSARPAFAWQLFAWALTEPQHAFGRGYTMDCCSLAAGAKVADLTSPRVAGTAAV